MSSISASAGLANSRTSPISPIALVDLLLLPFTFTWRRTSLEYKGRCHKATKPPIVDATSKNRMIASLFFHKITRASCKVMVLSIRIGGTEMKFDVATFSCSNIVLKKIPFKVSLHLMLRTKATNLPEITVFATAI